jgi:hypothetical protein
LSDDQLDNVEVTREFEIVSGVGGEPLTTSFILAMSPVITISIIRLIERWLENRRQEAQNKLFIEALNQASDESVKEFRKLVESNNQVSMNYSLTKKTDTE